MRYKRDWDLRTIPDDLLRAECGRRNALKRVTCNGGRPANQSHCPFCKKLFAASPLRSHLPSCRAKTLKSMVGQYALMLVGRKFQQFQLSEVNRLKIRVRGERFLKLPIKEVVSVESKKLSWEESKLLSKGSSPPSIIRLSGELHFCKVQVSTRTTEYCHKYFPRDKSQKAFGQRLELPLR